MTLLLGYMGYRTAESAKPSGKMLSVQHVRDAISSAELAPFGEVAGYPKLPPGFWDGDDFCVLVGLLIFKGKTGADPAWLNLVHDKARLTVATTETGYINTQLKYEWYKKCKELDSLQRVRRSSVAEPRALLASLQRRPAPGQLASASKTSVRQ